MNNKLKKLINKTNTEGFNYATVDPNGSVTLWVKRPWYSLCTSEAPCMQEKIKTMEGKIKHGLWILATTTRIWILEEKVDIPKDAREEIYSI